MTTALTSGDRVAGRFVLEQLLGEGGMGEVWSARHALTGKPVAIKVLKGTGAEVRGRFVQEARVAAAVRHPNVIAVHDVLELDDGQPVLVMDLLEGEPLSALLERRGALPLDELLPIGLQVLAGLGAAHAAGVVHRDMKPDNIFLARGPGGEVTVKVLDFGIAKLTALTSAVRSTNALTQTGSILGTPHYMAPEQVFGEKELDHRADFWSLGVVLYECLTGACPIHGDNIGQVFKAISQRTFVPLSERLPSLDREVARLVDAMMSARPEDRPGSAQAIAEVLARRGGQASPSIAEPRWRAGATRPENADDALVTIDATLGAEPRGRRRAGASVAYAGALVGVLVGAAGIGFGLRAGRASSDDGAPAKGAPMGAVTSSTSASPAVVASIEAAMPTSSATTPTSASAATSALPPSSPSPRGVTRESVAARTSPRPGAGEATPTGAKAPANTPTPTTGKTGGIHEVSPY